MHDPAPSEDPRPGAATGDHGPALEARGLGCERNEHWLFRDLALRLRPGELLHVAGDNGSGKTTLLRILCGLLAPDEGRVSWCGRELPAGRDAFLSALVFVGHKTGLKGELTAVENLNLERALMGPTAGTTVEEALHRLGVAGAADRPCRRLSAGQQQRVALARLAVSGAPLWILDEPLAALDRPGQALRSEEHTSELQSH